MSRSRGLLGRVAMRVAAGLFAVFVLLAAGGVIEVKAGGWCGSVICPGDILFDQQKLMQNIKIAAQKAAEYAKAFSEYASWINAQGLVNNAFGLGGDQTTSADERVATLRLFSKEVGQDLEIKLTQRGLSEKYYVDTIAEAGKASKMATFPDQTQDVLCYTIAARQMIPVMVRFSSIISNWITTGIVNDRTGNGPSYIARDYDMTCGKLNENDPVTGSRLDNSSCAATDPKAVSSTGTDAPAPAHAFDFEDAGITSATLASGESVLVMPPLKDHKIETEAGETDVKVPEAQEGQDKVRQQMWIAARDYCSRLAGPRPAPPKGKALDTPEGRKKMTAYATCTSLYSSYVKQCANRVAYITRPNCEEELFKPFCEMTKRGCLAAQAHNIVLPDSFDSCQNGLSLYEAEYVSHILCESQGQSIAATASGADSDSVMGAQNSCLLAHAHWEWKKAQEEANFLDAAKGLQDLAACWKAVE